MGFRPQKKIRLPGILAYFLTRNPNFWVPSFKNFAKMLWNRLFSRPKNFSNNFFSMSLKKTRFLAILSELLKKTNVRIRKLVKKYVDMDRNHFFDFYNFTCFYRGFSWWLQKNIFFQKKFFSKKSIFEPVLLNFSKRGPENSDSSSKNSPV